MPGFDAERFLRIPEEKRLFARILIGIILLFLLLLAVRSCSRPGRASAREYLRKLTLQDPKAQIDGLIGLAHRRAARTAPKIEELLFSTDDEGVRKAAAFALFVLDRSRFNRCLTCGKEEVRITALKVLIEREGEEKALQPLTEALKDGTEAVKRFAFDHLAGHPGETVIDAMASLVEDASADTSLRVDAARFLGEHGDVRILVRLGRFIEDVPASDRSVVVEAVRETVKKIEKRLAHRSAG